MRRQRSQPADHGRASRETILDGAFEAFTKGGYRDTAVDDIAAAAEISKGGIYFHFPTKEAIFRELMRTTADKLVGKVETAVAAESDPIRKAEVALATVLEVFAAIARWLASSSRPAPADGASRPRRTPCTTDSPG